MMSCSNDDGGSETPSSEERYTGDTYQDLHSPWVKDPSQTTHVTRWECVLFGSYPANEVVSGSFSAVDDYALADGDVIIDATLYHQLEQAEWTDNDTEIDGKRYHRLNGSGAVTCSTDREQHYRWTDTETWHYFAYAPIKWRILKISGTKAVLLADRMPDTCPFHDKDEATSSLMPFPRQNVMPSKRPAWRMRLTPHTAPTAAPTHKTTCSYFPTRRCLHPHWPQTMVSMPVVASMILPAVSVPRSMPSAEEPGGHRLLAIAATPSGLCVLAVIRPAASLISVTLAISIIKVQQSPVMMPPCCLPSLST